MAGLIPQNFIDELLNRVDIVEVIDRRVTLKKAGKIIRPAVRSTRKRPPLSAFSLRSSFFIVSDAAPAAMPSVSS